MYTGRLLLKPAAHVVFGIENRRAEQRQPLPNRRRRAQVVQILQAGAPAAAFMSAEGHDELAAEIMGFEEGPHGHGHRAAPVRIAQEHDVVRRDAVQLPFQDRAGPVGLFLSGGGYGFFIVVRIGNIAPYMEQRPSRILPYHAGCPLRVANGQIDQFSAGIILTGVRKIRNETILFPILHALASLLSPNTPQPLPAAASIIICQKRPLVKTDKISA